MCMYLYSVSIESLFSSARSLNALIVLLITCFINGSIFGKTDLLAIFHVMRYDVKCGMCHHKFDCRETTLSNAANHFKIFLIEFEICLYKDL